MIEVADDDNIGYDETYDAYYYIDTNEWVEPRCCDPQCEFCIKRPAKHIVEDWDNWKPNKDII